METYIVHGLLSGTLETKYLLGINIRDCRTIRNLRMTFDHVIHVVTQESTEPFFL